MLLFNLKKKIDIIEMPITHMLFNPCNTINNDLKKNKLDNTVLCSVTQYPILCEPMDCSLPGSFVRGIFPVRILEWAAISFSRGSL